MILCYSDDAEANELKRKYALIYESELQSNQFLVDLINETNFGVLVKDKELLKKIIYELYGEFEPNCKIHCESHGVEKYSRKIQIEKLTQIINKL